MRESKVRLFLADRRRSDKDIPPSTRVRPRSKSIWTDRSDRVGFAANSLKETKQFSQNCDSVLFSSVSSLSAVYYYSTQRALLFEIKLNWCSRTRGAFFFPFLFFLENKLTTKCSSLCQDLMPTLPTVIASSSVVWRKQQSFTSLQHKHINKRLTPLELAIK